MCEKIFAIHLSNGFISRKYKSIRNIHINKTDNPTENLATVINRPFTQKTTYKWPINFWKDV